MFDEHIVQRTLVELENAVSNNNADVHNSCIYEITAVATVSASGQEFLHQHNACSTLYCLLKTVSDKFKLDDDESPKPKAIFQVGDAVDTVWGTGNIESHRDTDDIYVVRLNNWKLAQGQSPTLYLNAESMTKRKACDAVRAGDAVSTVWGTGIVQDHRESDDIYIVLLDNWKLAQGQSPTLYLNADSLKKRDFEHERKLAEVKAAHDDALEKTAALLTAIGAIMRRSLPKSHSCSVAIHEFVSLGFIDLVSECLNKFMHHAATVNAACWCVMVMCSDDPDNQVALAKAGACEGVMQALSTHAGNADIIEYVCRAARNLTSNLSIAHHCVGSGIGELIACVIMLHMDKPAQCEAGLWVVTNLSCDPNNATVLGSIGMCDCITTVLRTHLDNAAIAAAAAWAVKNLACGSTFNYTQFIHTDVCNSLMHILKNFSGATDVLSPTLWAIANITCDPALSKKINENDQICNLLVSVLCDFIDKTSASVASEEDDVADNLDIVEAAMWALRNVVSVGAANNVIHDSVAVSIHSVLTVAHFLQDESLVDSAVATVVNILANLPQGSHSLRDQLRELGFAPVLKGLLTQQKSESVLRHACKAISLFATESEFNRQNLVDIGACSAAVALMHARKEEGAVVASACEVLFTLHYIYQPAEVARLADLGMIIVNDKNTETSSTEICVKPFDDVVAAWLPDGVTSETGWLAKSSV